MANKIVIFTDLDGTLLDHDTYSYESAKPALVKAQEIDAPIIPVTSKTYAENKAILSEMDLWGKVPFIVENGGAIFIPKGLFSFDIKSELPEEKVSEQEDFVKIEFGKPYEEVRKVMKEAAEEANLEIKGIGDMSVEEFATETNLPLDAAERAKQRMYQEGFKILNVPEEQQKEAIWKIRKAIEDKEYFMSIGGRFCQIMGVKAKIKSVETLSVLFRKEYGNILTVGLGDTQADIEFLEHCDEGYLVRNPKKAVDAEVESDKIHLVKEAGPKGWNKVVLSQLAKVSAKNEGL